MGLSHSRTGAFRRRGPRTGVSLVVVSTETVYISPEWVCVSLDQVPFVDVANTMQDETLALTVHDSLALEELSSSEPTPRLAREFNSRRAHKSNPNKSKESRVKRG